MPRTPKTFACSCGETNPENYYPYRKYECKACSRARVAKGSKKTPSCPCGETDPSRFTQRRKFQCLSCRKDTCSTSYINRMSDPEKKAKYAEYQREFQRKNVFKYRYRAALKRATERGMDFDLDEDFLRALYEKQDGKCHYTEIPFDNNSSNYSWSIDRVDNARGYTRDNVVLAATVVNYMKNDLSLGELHALAVILAQRLPQLS